MSSRASGGDFYILNSELELHKLTIPDVFKGQIIPGDIILTEAQNIAQGSFSILGTSLLNYHRKNPPVLFRAHFQNGQLDMTKNYEEIDLTYTLMDNFSNPTPFILWSVPGTQDQYFLYGAGSLKVTPSFQTSGWLYHFSLTQNSSGKTTITPSHSIDIQSLRLSTETLLTHLSAKRLQSEFLEVSLPSSHTPLFHFRDGNTLAEVQLRPFAIKASSQTFRIPQNPTLAKIHQEEQRSLRS